MAYQIIKSNGQSGFTVFDGPPDGKTATKIKSVEDLAAYAGSLNMTMAEALSHATANGWLDIPTANQWAALLPRATAVQTATAATQPATFGSELDAFIEDIKKATVGEMAAFIGIGVLAWLALSGKPKKD